MTSRYTGQAIALLTRHGKERVIAPVLEPVLGCSIHHVGDFDTDQLGSFTLDIPRAGDQLDTARRKARIGMELAGLPVGIASEGSFGADPIMGILSWNIEIVLLIDDRLDLEIIGLVQGPGRSAHLQTGNWTDMKDFAESNGFPEHQLVLRPENEQHALVYKGISDWNELERVFNHCRTEAGNAEVFAETDLRAFANPTRMNRIREATELLLSKLQSFCPECRKPGYWVVDRHPGLPCSLCCQPTRIYISETWQCTACGHSNTESRKDKTHVDPQHCEYCNP
jgi:hypothetical protein